MLDFENIYSRNNFVKVALMHCYRHSDQLIMLMFSTQDHARSAMAEIKELNATVPTWVIPIVMRQNRNELQFVNHSRIITFSNPSHCKGRSANLVGINTYVQGKQLEEAVACILPMVSSTDRVKFFE